MIIMTNKIYSIASRVAMAVLALFIGLSSVGCNKFLDKSPDDRTSIDTLDKAGQLLVGAYQNSRSYRFTFWSSDNATLAKGVSSSEDFIEDLYSWEPTIRNNTHQDNPASYWGVAYKSIAHVNRVLENLESLEATTQEEKRRWEGYKGEALLLRAYYHFVLVNLFAPHYDAFTADAMLGVPYATEPERNLKVNYDRLSVADTYTKIEEDLVLAITLLEHNEVFKQNNKYRFTLPTLYLFASRYYLFRNAGSTDAKLTISYGEKAIEAFGGIGTLRPWMSYYQVPLSSVDIKLRDVGLVQSSNSWVPFNWKYSMTNNLRDKMVEAVALVNPWGVGNDTRLAYNFQREGDIFAPAYFYEFVGGRSEATAYDLFPMREALLNVAEAHARLGDFTSYKTYMIALASSAYTKFDDRFFDLRFMKEFYKKSDVKLDKSGDINAMLHYLLAERRIYFLQQGMRWFDIKRYRLPVVHTLADGSSVSLWEKNPTGAYQIPEGAINSGMTPN